ncbi:MAG: DNA photolyase, partial [Deferribacterota bacterium]|nr:DNA photolyase [Deferribacterota bacterium]
MVYIEKSAVKGSIFKYIENNQITYEIIEENVVEELNDLEDAIVIRKSSKEIHSCPSTKYYRCCNYQVLDIMEGCPYNCSYCILKTILNHKNIIVNDTVDTLREELIKLDKMSKQRIGSGELSDSLALDNIVGLTTIISPIVNSLKNSVFEYKTKSVNIDNLLKLNPKNIIVSWSVNPNLIIKREELLTPLIEERLNAAKICAEYGYRLAFHFDPLILCENFEKEYKVVVEKIVEKVDEKVVSYISIGILRFMPQLEDIIRNNYLESNILANEFVETIDGKLRYLKPVRYYMVNYLYNLIRKYWKNAFIYLCMEDVSIWENVLGYDPGNRQSFE